MSKGNVLVIEDNKGWKARLKKYLEEAGFNVETASTLEDGKRKICESHYHFVTIDMQLDERTINPPEFEGFKILEKIVQSRRDLLTPTMIITGYHQAYEKFRNSKNLRGTFSMPKKNFDRQKFIECVTIAVEGHDVRFYNDK